MIKLNEDKELVAKILKKLDENYKVYGKRYCPCVLPTLYKSENSNDYECMCKEFRELEEGSCHCCLYIKIKEK